MVIEKYEYLLLELEARNREQQKEFLKDLLEGSKKRGKQEAIKEELEWLYLTFDSLREVRTQVAGLSKFQWRINDRIKELKSKIGGEDDTK